jgi:tetratricopeptide (TPR) repeat protein
MTRRAVGASDYALSKGGTREAWLARGEILLSAGNDNAIACFDKALEQSDPNDWKTAMHVGMALFDRKKFGSAYDYLKRAAQNKTTNAYLWHLMGKCAERLRFQEQAIQAYERACHIDPKNQIYKRSLESLHNTGPIKAVVQAANGWIGRRRRYQKPQIAQMTQM